jgi:hypothetical protein
VKTFRQILQSIVLPDALIPPMIRVAETQTAQGSMTLAVLRASECGWSEHPMSIAEEIDAHRAYFTGVGAVL